MPQMSLGCNIARTYQDGNPELSLQTDFSASGEGAEEKRRDLLPRAPVSPPPGMGPVRLRQGLREPGDAACPATASPEASPPSAAVPAG